VCVSALFGCATTPFSSEVEIERLERALTSSIAVGDTRVLEQVLSPDCVWLLPDGSILDKSQTIALMGSKSPYYRRLEATSVAVRVLGKVAVAHGEDRWERVTGVKGRFVWSDTWLFRDGRWQIVQVQDAQLVDH